MKKTADTATACGCLDLVEAARCRRVYPLMYCHMDILGHLDIQRLKRSVSRSSQAVPEVLYAYNFQQDRFVKSGYTADDVVRYPARLSPSLLRPDLSRRPQLQILVTPKGEHDRVIVIMSHILADGSGFLQYLYLLSALYNGVPLRQDIPNIRSIAPLLKNIQVLPSTQQTRHNRSASVPPLRSAEQGGSLLCLTTQISPGCMDLIRQKAKKSGASVNDVLIAAYARVIARVQTLQTVVLPCPADLRKFRPEWCPLTVANMTGSYQRVAVEIPPGCPFLSTLQQVHIELALQKSRYRCFAGIRPLDWAFHTMPRPLLRQAVRTLFPPSCVSYTNLGVIEDKKLSFQDCVVQNCFFTGTYRLPPDFQLTVSTFRRRCTLNCTFIGTSSDQQRAQSILEQVKHEILAWCGQES